MNSDRRQREQRDGKPDGEVATCLKKTEIGEIPDAWEAVAIGDLVENSAYGTSAKCSTDRVGFPVLRIPNVVTGKVSCDDLKYAKLNEKEVHRYQLREGDVLVVRTNGNPDYVGRTAVFPRLGGTWLYASYLIRLRARTDRVDPSFLHLAFSSQSTRKILLGSIRTSAGNYNLNAKGISNSIVALPPLSEQRKIAAILSSVDDAIEKTQAVIDQLQVVKKAMMQELLTRGLPGRHTRFKKTEVGEVPEEWEVVKVGDVVEKTAYGTSAKCFSEPVGLPVLRIPNVVAGEIDRTDLKYTRLTEDEIRRYRLHDGDVLVVRTNGNPDYVGRTAVVSQLDGTWLFASYLIRLQVDRKRIEPAFLHLSLGSPATRNILFGSIRTSAGNYNLNTKGIAAASIALPGLEEQQKIAGTIGRVEDRICAEQNSHVSLSDLKAALMSVLLTGEVRVKVDDDEGRREVDSDA